MRMPRTMGVIRTPDALQAEQEQTARALAPFNISFGGTLSNTALDNNIDCWKATGTSAGVANTEFAVAHQLLRVPIGFKIIQLDQAAIFYGTPTLGTAWTKATATVAGNIYLKCNVATVNFAIIII